ncbi:hypothetical protein ON010_g18000 [Phytophthora cinnamomi]|nr:hypothetical protein ON010_g18000 [Phytophthora cinnamomi]
MDNATDNVLLENNFHNKTRTSRGRTRSTKNYVENRKKATSKKASSRANFSVRLKCRVPLIPLKTTLLIILSGRIVSFSTVSAQTVTTTALELQNGHRAAAAGGLLLRVVDVAELRGGTGGHLSGCHILAVVRGVKCGGPDPDAVALHGLRSDNGHSAAGAAGGSSCSAWRVLRNQSAGPRLGAIMSHAAIPSRAPIGPRDLGPTVSLAGSVDPVAHPAVLGPFIGELRGPAGYPEEAAADGGEPAGVLRDPVLHHGGPAGLGRVFCICRTRTESCQGDEEEGPGDCRACRCVLVRRYHRRHPGQDLLEAHLLLRHDGHGHASFGGQHDAVGSVAAARGGGEGLAVDDQRTAKFPHDPHAVVVGTVLHALWSDDRLMFRV